MSFLFFLFFSPTLVNQKSGVVTPGIKEKVRPVRCVTFVQVLGIDEAVA